MALNVWWCLLWRTSPRMAQPPELNTEPFNKGTLETLGIER